MALLFEYGLMEWNKRCLQ